MSHAVSAIGHSSTAEFLSSLVGIQVNLNRIKIKMEVGQKALVFIIMGSRSSAEKELPLNKISQITYEFGILERVN